jgi:hypothetical protein
MIITESQIAMKARQQPLVARAGCYPSKRASLAPFLLVGAVVSLFTGCVVYRYSAGPPVVVAQSPPGTTVVVAGPPPAPVQEVVTIAPAVGLIWVPGVWGWEGRWVWEGGRWARPPYPGAVWVPHQYVYRNGVHVYIRGGWR